MTKATCVFIAAMDVDPDKEDLFNEVYDQEHVPSLLKVPGVLSVTRYKSEPFTLAIGGELKEMPLANLPRYSAVYELSDPSVLASDAWAEAVELGRWPSQVRPYTHNRQHELRMII